MRISCIIPTCDRPELVLAAIHSALSQTLKPIEVIVVNNGREKLTLPVDLNNQARVYNIVPYAGVAQARNFGAVMAAGDYLAFLDDDDLWPPEYLANVAEAIGAGARCVVSRLDQIVEGRQTVLKNPHGLVNVAHLLVRNPGTGGPNVVIERPLLFQVKGYDPKLPPSEDKGMILEVLLAGLPVVTLPNNPVIVGKQRGGFFLTSHIKLAEGIFQFTRKYGKIMSWRQYLYNWSKIFYYRYLGGRWWLLPASAVSGLLAKFFSPFRAEDNR